MREERFADMTVRLTGGSDHRGGGDGPLVVLMHGFGAPGTDLVGLDRALNLPPSVRFAFPEAPGEIPEMFGAKAWWMIDFARLNRSMADGPGSYANEVPKGMEAATDRIVAMIEALQKDLGVRNDQLTVGGFSQGAMAACNAVFTRSLTPAGLVILSGTPVNLEAWRSGMAGKTGVPVFQSHGLNDPILSFQAAETLRDTMRDAGLAAKWVPFRGGHEIPMPVLDQLGRFLRAS